MRYNIYMNRGVKFFVIGLIFLLPHTTYARTVQVLMGGNPNYLTSNSAARYTSLFGDLNSTWGNAVTSGVGGSREIISAAGVLQNFYVKANYPLGAGSYAVVVMKNGVATAMTCTITDPATSCSDSADSVRVSPGDEVEVRFTGAGGPFAGIFSTAVDFVPDVSNETLVAGTLNQTATIGAVSYSSFFNRDAFVAAEASTSQSLFAVPGVISGLRFSVTTAPGAGTTATFSVRANQATTSLACVLSGTSKTCSDTTNFASVPLAAWMDFSFATTTGAVATGLLGFGMKFVPTKINQFFFMGGSGVNNQTAATAYLPFSGTGVANATTTQADIQMVANPMTITDFYVGQTVTTGASGTRTYTLEVNGVATAATCSITGVGAVTGRNCSWSGSVTVNQGDLLDYKDTVTGTVSNGRARISTVATRIQPPTQHSLMGGFLKIIGGFIRIQ
jgi:hypothetical protein